MMGVWLFPSVLAGQVFDLNPSILARNYAVSGQFILTDEIGRFIAPHLLGDIGVISSADGRLSSVVIAWFSTWIDWSDLMLWSVVSAGSIALALIVWWLFVSKVFDRRIAWISTILMAFMPLYWGQAVLLDNYNLAFIFLFSSFAAFAYLQERSRMLALLCSGVLFGACASSKDTFLVFVPWFCIGYYWVHRSQWRTAIAGIAIFGFASLAVYLAPYIGDIRTLGYPMNQNLATFWPGASDIKEGYYLHAYPDPYTYFFDRAVYDQFLLTRFTELTQIQQYQQYKNFILFGIGTMSIAAIAFNGLWLFVGNIPEFFQQEYIGGVVLWLFILPGFLLLRRDRRVLAMQIVGLIVSAECVMRFFLHYSRNHLVDYGWALALLAAVGIAAVADMCARNNKHITAQKVTMFIVIVLVMQLVQANRTIFARRYARPPVNLVMSVSDAINLLPKESVVALGIGPSQVRQIAQFTTATVVPFAEDTLDGLLDSTSLGAAFETYGVTHVYGYSDEVLRRVYFQVGSVEELSVRIDTAQKKLSPYITWLLHTIR